MGDLVAHYEALLDEVDSTFLTDGGTVLVASGATVPEVVEALGGVGIEDVPAHELDPEQFAWSAYLLTEVEGGVLATEDTGYADPPTAVLVALSRDGRAAAVVRDNIQAHQRFGCARDGVLLFDEHEYVYLDERSRVPAELRELFDRAWVDLDDDAAVDDGAEDGTAVGMAMAEVVTGLHLVADDARRLASDDATVVLVRVLQYADELEG